MRQAKATMTTPNSRLLHALSRAVSAQVADPAPRLIGDDASYTLADLSQGSQALADVLAARGVQAGDRVAHLGRNSAAMIVLLFACARLGALLMPLNWRLSEKEWAWMLEDAAPRAIALARRSHCTLTNPFSLTTPLTHSPGYNGTLMSSAAGTRPIWRARLRVVLAMLLCA